VQKGGRSYFSADICYFRILSAACVWHYFLFEFGFPVKEDPCSQGDREAYYLDDGFFYSYYYHPWRTGTSIIGNRK
jgi:hypothetical protein